MTVLIQLHFKGLTVPVFRTIVRFERRSTVKLLMTSRTRKRSGAVDIGVCGLDVMGEVVDVSKHRRTDRTHRFAYRQPRHIVGIGVTPQCRRRPEPALSLIHI